MSAIAIITARGGSKRIPRKNIKDFCGKPILAYSIEAAINSGLFEEVMVSTDDPEIAEISIKYGASVPFYRSPQTSNDFAGTGDVLKEVIEEYKRRGCSFDYMCCIYPTAPFVTPQKLKKAFELLKEENADGVSPIVRFSYPPQRSFVLREGRLVPLHPEYMPCRSQDLEPIFHDVGQFYFYKMESWGKNKKDYYSVPFELPETEVQDIDNIEDWEIAELKYKLMVEKAHV